MPSRSQQPKLPLTPERDAANALQRAVQAEGGRRLKHINKRHARDLCATDARRWGDGIVGYERITYADEQELVSKMLGLVRQWKTKGSQHPSFDPSDFPKLSRYAVADCGIVDGQAQVAVAVYRSAWDTYWAKWANLLGK